MANHKSAIKRIRANAAKRLRNRYQAKTTRNAIKKLRNTTNPEEAKAWLPQVVSMLERLAKKNVIHKNKASNNKSKLTKFVNKLAEVVVFEGYVGMYFLFIPFLALPECRLIRSSGRLFIVSL